MRPSSGTTASAWLRRRYASMTNDGCCRRRRGGAASVPARSVFRSARGGLRQDLQVLVEPIPRLGGALLHTRLEHRVALLDRVDLGGARERGLAVVLLEHVGLGPRLTRHALEPERPHEPLGADDLAVLAEEHGGLVRAVVGTSVRDPPGTPG